ncbi:hypothetical protein J7I44_00505 [Frateuria sp. MAH-13]|uniref:Uncharacterized protein n=1 Tax=Frateuria flava TaxID=2821489 RepID=A0ABS4DI91_9GAMM|nr:hypothetical protein [Frateuria flava]
MRQAASGHEGRTGDADGDKASYTVAREGALQTIFAPAALPFDAIMTND